MYFVGSNNWSDDLPESTPVVGWNCPNGDVGLMLHGQTVHYGGPTESGKLPLCQPPMPVGKFMFVLPFQPIESAQLPVEFLCQYPTMTNGSFKSLDPDVPQYFVEVEFYFPDQPNQRRPENEEEG